MLDHPLETRHRLFFALVPPPVLARQIANAASWFDAEGSAIAAERLHVTMAILDDRPSVPSALAAALRGVGAAIAAAPIDVVLDRVVGSGRSIALRPGHKLAALSALHRQIAQRCAAVGIAGPAGYAFAPHMTLGYRGGRPFNTALAPVRWTARELVLVHSHLGKTRHERIGSWPLAAPKAQFDLFGGGNDVGESADRPRAA